MPSITRHSLLFLTLSLLFLGTIRSEPSNWETGSIFLNTLSFFLILTIGISHGSLDHIKGYKLLKKYQIKNKIIFYLSYLLVSILIIFMWLILPSLTLIVFLFVATYHFGKEDSLDGNNQSFFRFLIFGLPIILAPLSFHFDETLNIFKVLYIENENLINILYFFQEKKIFIILLVISLIIGCYFSGYKYVTSFTYEKVAIVLLNITCHPLIAFTIYFCFLHSIRHSFKLAIELNKANFKKGFKEFLNKSLPLTLVTAIVFIISLIFLTNYNVLNDAILKVIFIGLASLTFPHILLEYLLEKNEKQRN